MPERRPGTLARDLRGVTVIVPAYQEQTSVPQVVRAVRTAFASSGQSLEVLVVDDGSSDATARAADDAGATVIRHPQNMGYGRAILTGTRAARFDNLAIIDADDTYPAEHLPELVAALDEHDMVVGARRGLDQHEWLGRRIARRVVRLLAEYVAGATIPDVNSGMRAFRRELVYGAGNMLCGTFSFTTTLTLSAFAREALVKYVDVGYQPRLQGSHVRSFRDTLRLARILLEASFHYSPMKAVLPFALAAGIVALVLAIGFALKPSSELAMGAGGAALAAVAFGVLGSSLDANRTRRSSTPEHRRPRLVE